MASNIVEGCARETENDYLHFLVIAYASARELQYQISLSFRLGYMSAEDHRKLEEACELTTKTLNSLVRALRQKKVFSN